MQIFTVSVVIPVYNRAHIVHESIDSVLNQSGNFNVEIIIVDDYSDDQAVLINVIDDIKRKVENDRFTIKLFLHEKNRHGGAARNTGIKNSTGEFIAFLDSDDYWHRDKLKVCLEKNINENDIIYSQIRDRGLVRPKQAFDSKISIDEYLLVVNGTMQTSSLFMHRSFACKILFDPTLTRFQDFDFIIRAAKIFAANFIFIEQVLVEMGENDKGNRISSSVDYLPALYWLTKISPILTQKSKAAFAFNRLINYASNSLSRHEIISFILQFECYLYLRYWNYKVIIKIILGKNQKWLRK